MPSTRSGASYNPLRSFQKGYRRDYGRSQSVTEGQGADTATRSLNGYIQSHPEGLQQCISAQRVPDPCRSVEKLHEFLTECGKIAQWMASIDGKAKHDAFNRGMEGKRPSTTQESAKNSPSSQQQQFQCEKAATSSEKGQGQTPATEPYSKCYRIQKIQQNAIENVF
ncbi:hypothetical protein O181_126918 [Austropuccinia psidii MF-1]|uniref:Uncharacterized protein n=1 Tax=Austropuccinia psidii MF-1 TaxID=1389203 RepID=A0A9Q3KS80_9BASI|nr:hypothetical protein [Austropuccinia psidii MF-1]